LPQELRLAGITSTEGANAFCGKVHREFNCKFSVRRRKKARRFGYQPERPELDFHRTDGASVERQTVASRTVVQIDKTRFRYSLAGSTVTIHEHLDEPSRSVTGLT